MQKKKLITWADNLFTFISLLDFNLSSVVISNKQLSKQFILYKETENCLFKFVLEL